MEQPRLFHAEHLPVRLAYQNLFSHLPIFPPHGPPVSPQGGRPPIDRNALLRALLRRLALPVEAVCADSVYDANALLKFTVDELHAQPVVAPYPRRHANPGFRVQGAAVVCPAKLARSADARA
jgi:hypothetical protein